MRPARSMRQAFAGAALLAAALLGVALLGGGCGGSTLVVPGTMTGDATMPPLLADLELTTVGVGSRVLHVAIAGTPVARSRGLAGTEDLGPLDGMLFVYPEPVESTFWMRGVLMPLDIVFVGADGRVLTRLTMPVCLADPCPTYPPPGPFRWAVETPAGGLGGVVAGDLLTIAGG